MSDLSSIPKAPRQPPVQGKPPGRPAVIMGVVMVHDIAMAWIAMFLAVELRYAMQPDMPHPAGMSLLAASMFALACLVVFPFQRLHRGVWRFTALNDVFRVVNAVVLANLLFLLAMFFLTRLDGLPRSSLLIQAPLAAALIMSSRLLRQTLASGDWRSVVRLEDRTKAAAILAGGHEALDAFLRDAMRRRSGPPFRVRGLVEPNAEGRGRLIRGAPVLGGPAEAESALISLGGNGVRPQLVIVDPNLRREDMDAFMRAAANARAGLVRAHADETRGGANLSPLDAADLLRRRQYALDTTRARSLVTGRRIFVTGAGGTIGAELCRQIAVLGPEQLILYDSSEYNLYAIDQELRELGIGELLIPVLGDVRDVGRLNAAMATSRPHVVLHAAALKHVPLMELNPTEAVMTNVYGTMCVADAAVASHAETFVLISTDKAVRPNNVMGASKRAAELYVQAMDARGNAMRAVSVRFGNVLGSTGSVVPLFERQIAQGGPITVTHPDITRFFMTVQEACALVLQSAAIAPELTRGGGVYVLDMGEPIRIDDLARALCRMRGYTPDVDIPITYTGLRPGEKVHEELFYEDERVKPTAADGVLAADAPMMPIDELRPRLEAITTAARERNRDRLYAELNALLPDFDYALGPRRV